MNGIGRGPGSEVEAAPSRLATNRTSGERSRRAASIHPSPGTAIGITGTDSAKGGGPASGPLPILDYYGTSARKHCAGNSKTWWELTEEEKRAKKFKRAYQRFMLGSGMPGDYRLLTLTTPPEFKGDLHCAWRKFLMRMRRRGLIGEYYAVKEWNKEHTCQHIHVVLRLDYIGYQVARQQWQAVTGALWIHVDRVHSSKGMARYLGKYLNKAYDDEPGKRSYWYAYEWIYRKWRGFSKEMFKVGEPVTADEHEQIHNMKDFGDRIKYMNRRLIAATLEAVLAGMHVTKLVQFASA